MTAGVHDQGAGHGHGEGREGRGRGKEVNTRKFKGKAKREAVKKVGERAAFVPLDQPTAAKSMQAGLSNGRSALAGGRKARASPEENANAFPAIKAICVKFGIECDERGMPKAVVQGAEMTHEQLEVALEVASFSVRSVGISVWTDQMAFVHKLRTSIYRFSPGPSEENTKMRRRFGLHVPMRATQPHTMVKAARALLRGKKWFAGTRAAKLIIAADEKQLRAIIQAVPKVEAEQEKASADGTSHATQLDILNTALELFYDEFSGTIGMVLAGDEVARVNALKLVPRRPEQRSGGQGEPGEGGGSGEAAASREDSPALVKP